MSEPAIAATATQNSVQQEQQVTVISESREAQQLPMVASLNALSNKPASKQMMPILPNLNKRHKNLAPISRRTPTQLNAALSFQATQEDLKKNAYAFAIKRCKELGEKSFAQAAHEAEEVFECQVLPNTVRKVMLCGRDTISRSGPKGSLYR